MLRGGNLAADPYDLAIPSFDSSLDPFDSSLDPFTFCLLPLPLMCGARDLEQLTANAALSLQVSPAPLNRLHTFLATSDIHLEHKLKISRAECIEQVPNAVLFCTCAASARPLSGG